MAECILNLRVRYEKDRECYRLVRTPAYAFWNDISHKKAPFNVLFNFQIALLGQLTVTISSLLMFSIWV